MLDYTEFRTKLKEQLISNMSVDFQTGYEVVLEEKPLPNKPEIKQDALSLKSHVESTKLVVSPNVFLMPVYEDWFKKRDNGDFSVFIKEIARKYEEMYRNKIAESLNKVSATKTHSDGAPSKEDLFLVVENAEQVKDLLKNVVSKSVGNYVLVVNVFKERSENALSCEPLTKSMAKKMKLGDSEAFMKAFENTNRLFPATVEKLSFDQMYVSNEIGKYGATCVFLPNGPIAELSEKMGKDIVIYPSSKDGLIIEPLENNSKEHLDEIVNDMREYAKEHEVLSDMPLLYSFEEKKLITNITNANVLGEKKKKML